MLAEQMVMAQWQLRRLWATQTGVYLAFDAAYPSAGESHPQRLAETFAWDSADAHTLDRMSLHQVRLVNLFNRCGRRLDALREQARRSQDARRSQLEESGTSRL